MIDLRSVQLDAGRSELYVSNRYLRSVGLHIRIKLIRVNIK
jgi:hypothetical protein